MEDKWQNVALVIGVFGGIGLGFIIGMFAGHFLTLYTNCSP